MSELEWKTKKEKILEYAQRDPFLKIEDLAKQAKTTSRYVRTILSEANLSLTELRKEYARNMENFHRNHHDKLLLWSIRNNSLARESKIQVLDELLFNNPQDFNQLSVNVTEAFFHQSYVHYYKQSPWCISTILLARDFFEIKDNNFTLDKLFLLFTEKLKLEELELSDLDLEIELATPQISSLLTIPAVSPVFRLKQTLEKASAVKALTLVYFNSRQISLSLSANNGLIIKRKGLVG